MVKKIICQYNENQVFHTFIECMPIKMITYFSVYSSREIRHICKQLPDINVNKSEPEGT